MQALSSVQGGYDLLAPKFDHTPFRTPDGVLDAAVGALRSLGPFGRGLDVCCGTGAGVRVLRSVCQGPIIGVDFSAGMLTQARGTHPDANWVRGDGRALPFAGAFDLAVSFGALGHFLPAERPALFAGVYRALRPGGVFAFPIGAPQPITSRWYWALLGFDAVIRVRNAVWRPPFVMYYRNCPLHAVRDDLTGSGFTVTTVPLTALGRREDGSPRYRLVLARRTLPVPLRSRRSAPRRLRLHAARPVISHTATAPFLRSATQLPRQAILRAPGQRPTGPKRAPAIPGITTPSASSFRGPAAPAAGTTRPPGHATVGSHVPGLVRPYPAVPDLVRATLIAPTWTASRTHMMSGTMKAGEDLDEWWWVARAEMT